MKHFFLVCAIRYVTYLICFNHSIYDIIDFTKSKSEFKIGANHGWFRLIFCSNWAHEREIFSAEMLNQPSLHFSLFGNNLWSLKAENLLHFTFTRKMNNSKVLSKHSLIRMGFIDDIQRSISCNLCTISYAGTPIHLDWKWSILQ